MTFLRFVSVASTLALIALAPACDDNDSSEKKNSAQTSEADNNDVTAQSREEDSNGFQAVSSESDLPACKDANEDQVIYAQQEEALFVCADGDWEELKTRGPEGPKGDPGKDGQNDSLPLYEKYRKGIFRIEVTCNKVDATCNSAAITGGTGSGFLCAPNQVCTNFHVASCRTINGCEYEMGEVLIHGLKGDRDSLMNGDDLDADADEITLVDPILQKVAPAVTRVAGRDLAMIALDDAQPSANVLKISQKPYTESIQLLDPILSMSFPLGFTDMYTDLGAVNSTNLADCQNSDYRTVNEEEGIVSCPGRFYHFATTNDTDHGSSGSPLINVKTGEVVGVTSAGTEGENANYTWAIDASLFQSEL